MITVTPPVAALAPSGNPIVWRFQSNTTDVLVYIKVDVKTTTGALISTLRAYPTPDNVKGSRVDLSAILDAYMKSAFLGLTYAGGGSLVDALSGPVMTYRVECLEYTQIAGVIGPVSGSGPAAIERRAFKGKLDKLTFAGYTDTKFAVPGTNLKFLTTKPDMVEVNEFTEDAVYFLRKDFTYRQVRVVLRNALSSAIITLNVDTPDIGGGIDALFRINLSPAFLSIYSGVPLASIYFITVSLHSDVGASVSEGRTYVMKPSECKTTPINLFFLNKFGAYDQILVTSREGVFQADRTTIKANDFLAIGNNDPSYINGDVYYPSTKIITATPKYQLKVTTASLSDAQVNWLSGLVASTEALIKYNGVYMPVIVEEDTLTLTARRALSTSNIKTFTLTLPDGFTPDFR